MKITLEEAAFWLIEGRNVAIPTETVYGLAASVYHPKAISGIFQIKSRPRANPLIVHVHSINDLVFAQTDLPCFKKLVDAFWPGPLSFILPLTADLDEQITAGLKTVAVRSPSHELCRQLLSLTGPLVAPSANPSGKPSPTEADHVERDYQAQVAVLDGGVCSAGVESTIIAWDDLCKKWVLARLGSLMPESIEEVLGYSLERRLKSEVAICPGQHWRHYAPQAELVFKQTELVKGMAVIGFENRSYPTEKTYFLGSLDDPKPCLEKLYATLRLLDVDHISKAWIDMDFPLGGLWETLRERLMKAASSS